MAKKQAHADELHTAELWDDCVAMLLGGRHPFEEREKRQGQALQLAAAALRAAGAHTMALAVAGKAET